MTDDISRRCSHVDIPARYQDAAEIHTRCSAEIDILNGIILNRTRRTRFGLPLDADKFYSGSIPPGPPPTVCTLPANIVARHSMAVSRTDEDTCMHGIEIR